MMNRDEMRRREHLRYTARLSVPDLDYIADGVILALWRQYIDTLQIAKHMNIPEWQVHNRLLHIRNTEVQT
jgi:hypothetical protein